jgi:hypothetical protein
MIWRIFFDIFDNILYSFFHEPQYNHEKKYWLVLLNLQLLQLKMTVIYGITEQLVVVTKLI